MVLVGATEECYCNSLRVYKGPVKYLVMYRPFATTTSQRLALRTNAFRELSQAANIPAGLRIRYHHLRTQQVLSSSHDYAY
jgi:hypothetical protein